MSSRSTGALTVLCAIALSGAACVPQEPSAPPDGSGPPITPADPVRPTNVLLIVVDDLNTSAVSAYGNPAVDTPRIDALAAQGVRFTHAYSQYPVCGPSRASMLTGYYPHGSGAFGYVSGREYIGYDRQMWPELFADEGWYTARVSKVFHMGVPDDILLGASGADDPTSWVQRFNSQGAEWQTPGEGELVQGNPTGTAPIANGNVMTIVKADGPDAIHPDARTTATAIELMFLHRNEPFFLAVGYVRPHVPFVAPRSHFDAYPHESIALPPVVPGDWNDIPAAGINYVTSAGAQMSPEQEQKAIAGYYASVSFVDEQVGRLLDAVDVLGLADDTLVIFTSDHGFHLGEHGFWMKKGLHEESVRVPLVVRGPGIAPGESDSMVELVDLYPTTAEVMGLRVPDHLQGRSFLRTLRDPDEPHRADAFAVTDDGTSYLLRDPEWAYMQYREDGSGGVELYDMVNDPGQFTNLAGLAEHAEIEANLRDRLLLRLQEATESDLNE
ncbi:MAG: sulfatase [Myxococcota bacterium]